MNLIAGKENMRKLCAKYNLVLPASLNDAFNAPTAPRYTKSGYQGPNLYAAFSNVSAKLENVFGVPEPGCLSPQICAAIEEFFPDMFTGINLMYPTGNQICNRYMEYFNLLSGNYI